MEKAWRLFPEMAQYIIGVISMVKETHNHFADYGNNQEK